MATTPTTTSSDTMTTTGTRTHQSSPVDTGGECATSDAEQTARPTAAPGDDDNVDDKQGGAQSEHSQQKYSMKDFKIKKKIGGGAEGAVYLADHLGPAQRSADIQSEDGEVAIKSVVCHTDAEIETTRKELTFLMTLRHENIVNHMAFWDEKHKSFLGEETRFYLVMEYCRGGSLEDYIVKRRRAQQAFEHELIESWACQICECMLYMHSQSIIHRDIKPENILLTADYLHIKVCDFGFTKKFDAVLTGTVLGTVVYMAPEIFENKKYDESVDIWSLGVVLLQLLMLKTQREVPDVRIDILRKPHFIQELLKDCGSTRIASVCEACLKIDPVERPTAQEILEFFQDKHVSDIRKKSRTASHLKIASTIDIGTDPLVVIKSEKGREFWRSCGWTEKMQVTWLEFREAYQKFMNWKRMSKDQERGLKKILVFVLEGSETEQISCFSFHDAIETCGFPFNLSVLYAIEKYREVADGGSKRNYSLPMSPEEFEEARDRYLQMIIEHDKIFVDPVSQETLSVDQHCAPLKLVTDEEWDALMEHEYDMDYEDDKLLRLERLGQVKDQSQHENAIEYLVSQTGHKFIILGAAAAGKSTMMRLLMYKAALRAKEDPSYLIPIFVPISNLSSFPKDMDFRLKCIRASADSMLNRALRYPDIIEHFLMTVIRKQQALLLMDGLDEAATAEDRSEIERNIHNLGESRTTGVIVTSRVSGFEHDEEGRTLFSGYTLARVQPLTYDIQMQISQRRGITSETFFQSLKGKYSELAKTPLLLSLMIQEFKRSNSLPDIRAELYEQAINTMIDIYFEKTRPNMKLADRKKLTADLRVFLANLACYLHNSRTRDFVDSEIDAVSGAEEIWSEILRPDIDYGKFSLIIVLNDKYRFSHLSFQEYFVASTWADCKKESEIRVYERQWLGLGQAQLNFSAERVKSLIIDPWYRETFLLCAGAMSKDDFTKWANFLLRLYRKQGHVIDSIVYNMVRERPSSEQHLYKDIIKALNSEKKLKIVLDGLIHQSEDLREMALSRVRLYNDFQKISRHLIRHLSDDNNYAAEALSIVIPHGDADTVTRLLAELSSKDPKIRAKVCFVLGNIAEPGDQSVVDALLKLVDDKDINVLTCVCEALCKVAKVGDKNVLHVLDLQLDDYERRAPAAEALGVIAEPFDRFVIGRLSKICKMCEEAAYALGKLASKTDRSVVNTLVECIKENAFDDTKIIEAVGMLAERNDHESQDYLVGRLVELLSFRKRKIAYRAAAALGAVVGRGDEQVVTKLLGLLDDTTSRERVVCALGFTANKGDERVICALLELLGDKSLQYIVREQCAIALSKLAKRSDKEVIDALCARLGDTEEVVNAVADALLTISDKDNEDVLDAFLQLTRHPDSGVVEHACQILGKVTSRGNSHVTNTLLRILSNTNHSETLRSVAAESLGLVATQDDQTIIDKLVEFVLQETAIYIRQFSVRAVANLISTRTNEKVADTLFQMVTTENDVVVKEETIKTLSRICDPRRMIELLRNKSYKLYRPVIFSIVVKAIRLLREEDPNWTLGQSSIELVHKIKSIESQYVLMESSSSIQ